jgi:RNA polymerase sigma-70 factor, ECF subfamily
MPDIGRLLEAELPKLRRYAQLLVRNSDRAEDLVQSCLARALGKQNYWRKGSDLRAWLFTIIITYSSPTSEVGLASGTTSR